MYGFVLQREPLDATCGSKARSGASGRTFGKMGTMAKMGMQHSKVDCSGTKLGTVSMALYLQRDPHWAILEGRGKMR